MPASRGPVTEDENNPKKIPPLSEQEKAAVENAGDAGSTAETKQIASGQTADKLKQQAQVNEAGRTEKFRDHFEFLALITLYLAWTLFLVIGTVWAYHLVAPPGWCRLPNEQIGHIQSILAGGVIASIATGHMKRRLGE